MSYVVRAMLYGQYLEAHFACWILCYGYVQSGKMLLSLMESCLEMESRTGCLACNVPTASGVAVMLDVK